MSNIQKNNIEQAIQLILEIYEGIREENKIVHDELWKFHGEKSRFPEIEKEFNLYRELTNLLIESNPEMISEVIILDKILYGVIGLAIFNKYNYPPRSEVRENAEKIIFKLVNYESWKDVDIPLFNLEIDSASYKFGLVELIPFQIEDKVGFWWDMLIGQYGDSVDSHIKSFGRIRSPGDSHKSREFAFQELRDYLLVLKGMCFQIVDKEIYQFGIVNEFPVSKTCPYRIHNADENFHIDMSGFQGAKVGPPFRPYYLYQDILAPYDEELIQVFGSLISNKDSNRLTQIQSKVVNGFSWIGEATKPDTISPRFIKLSNALEAFIGGEANEEYLTTRGITATLSERAAFLLGTNQESRLEIDREIRKYYGKRSDLVHGRSQQVTSSDFEKFGLLVRNIGWELLRNVDTFNNINEFQRWVINPRYEN